MNQKISQTGKVDYFPGSNCDGKIQKILLVNFLRNEEDILKILEFYFPIFWGLPKKVFYQIVIQLPLSGLIFEIENQDLVRKFEAAIFSRDPSMKGRVEIILFNNHFFLELFPTNSTSYLMGTNYLYPLPELSRSVWAQDVCSIIRVKNSETIVLTYPALQNPYTQISLSTIVAGKPHKAYLRPTSYIFEGGNILGFSEVMIIGKDTLVSNIPNFSEMSEPEQRQALESVGESFKALFGAKEIFVCGSEKPFVSTSLVPYSQGDYQPVFHIDMYITPAGTTTVSEEEVEILLFIGELVYEKATEGIETNPVNQLLSQMKKNLDETAYFFEHFDKGGLRFKVIRIPLYLNREFGVFYSYNNCLVENCTDKASHAYLPDFVEKDSGKESRKRQKEVISIFEKEDFEVTLIKGGWEQFAKDTGGSLHCVTKVLKRDLNIKDSC